MPSPEPPKIDDATARRVEQSILDSAQRMSGRQHVVEAAFALISVVAAKPLPLLAEYPRLIRSLAYAFVWETWPDTTSTGAST